jgi:protein-disulfide isomerase
MNKQTLFLITSTLIGVAIFIGLAYTVTQKKDVSVTIPEAAIILPTDHVMGNRDSKNVIVEYADFQCPACKVANELMKDWKKDETFAKIASSSAIVYRHFPLPQHKNAMAAAIAAEAAGKQGKYSEMADMLFAKQDLWGNFDEIQPKFESFAKEIGLNVEQFVVDQKDKALADKVLADMASGSKFGVDSTPSFYINGKKVQAQKLTDIKDAIIESGK